MIEDPKRLKVPKEIADKISIEANNSTSCKEEVLSSREIWERNVKNGLIEYDEEANQLVIRAKNDKSALEQIEKARNKGWIKNDKRSASDILAEQAIDPFYKKAPDDKVWWLNNIGIIGEHVFSFDREKTYNLFSDYPHNLAPGEKEIFDKENPYWADFLVIDNESHLKALRKAELFSRIWANMAFISFKIMENYHLESNHDFFIEFSFGTLLFSMIE